MSLEQFENDEKTIDAVVRNFEIIGEAANRVDEEIRKKHPDVEWRRVIGLRHRMVHEYFGIDLQIIWQIKESKLKDFQLEIESFISELSE